MSTMSGGIGVICANSLKQCILSKITKPQREIQTTSSSARFLFTL